jgi:hypothetical protein
VSWRILLLAALVALAGCPAGPSGDADPTPTVTAIPDPAGVGPPPAWSDPPRAATDAPTVNGSVVARDHLVALRPYFTASTRLRIDTGNRTLLVYRDNRTIAAHGVVSDRRYRGPATARFVPNATDATTASERYYDGDDADALRQVVDGRRRTGPGSLRFEPAVRTGTVGYLETVLDGAPLTNRTAAGTYVVTAERATLPLASVPRYLTAPRRVTVRALVRDSGRVERLAVTYVATDDGQPVQVEQTVVWGPPTAGEAPPAWVDGTPTASGDG